jgi:hypothetical protein
MVTRVEWHDRRYRGPARADVEENILVRVLGTRGVLVERALVD